MSEAESGKTPTSFFDAVVQAKPGDSGLERCIQCGTCGGSCPSAADMDHTPRALFALIKEEEQAQVLRSSTPWYCVSCYYCMVRCPQDVHVTDLMYTLKRFSIRKGLYKQSAAKDAPGFSESFMGFVENYGRSFELGLASRYLLEHHPLDLPKMAPMGLGMLKRSRMSLAPKRIKQIDSLKAILAKAKEMEDAWFDALEVEA